MSFTQFTNLSPIDLSGGTVNVGKCTRLTSQTAGDEFFLPGSPTSFVEYTLTGIDCSTLMLFKFMNAGEENPLFELENGSIFKFKKLSSSQIAFIWERDNVDYEINTISGNLPSYLNSLNIISCYCNILQTDDDTYGFSISLNYIESGNVPTVWFMWIFDLTSAAQEIWELVLSAAPSYNWCAWEQISGNGGQYRVNLTKLKLSAFDNFKPSGNYQRGLDYFDAIPTQSSIWNIFQNAQTGTEYKIAYSGDNYLTLTVTDTATPGVKKFTFKFYAPASSTTTPLLTTEKTVSVTGQTPDIDCYLSFVYDNEAQVAVFMPIIKVQFQAGLPQYLFGNETPSDDDMLYTFMWLQMSGAGTPDYPYDTGSTDNGGDPSGPKPGDHITPADVPTLGAMGTGMFTVYCPTDTQLGQIATYLWSDNLITNLRKYFNSVNENVISLYVLPYKPGTLPTKNFKVGNMESDTITGVEYLTSRFVSVDMGSVYVENEYDSYLDYSPYTKFECYLPGIGVVTLDADDIMTPTDPDTGTLKNADGATLSLKYTIDLMTGILVAFIFIDDEMRYQFSGKIGYEIPLTGETYSSMVRGFITAAAGLVGTVATGGLSAPISAASVGAAVSGTVNAMKPEIHRSGNLSGDASMMGKKTPYLIYHKPNKPLLENQALYTGFPSYKSGLLSEFEGFTQVIDAHVEGISCTEAERTEILQLLKSGVII